MLSFAIKVSASSCDHRQAIDPMCNAVQQCVALVHNAEIEGTGDVPADTDNGGKTRCVHMGSMAAKDPKAQALSKQVSIMAFKREQSAC